MELALTFSGLYPERRLNLDEVEHQHLTNRAAWFLVVLPVADSKFSSFSLGGEDAPMVVHRAPVFGVEHAQ